MGRMTCILLLIGRMTCILLLMGRMTCILLLIGRVKEKEYRVCVYYRGDETGTEALEFVDMIRAVRVLLLEQNKKSVKRDLEVLKETHDLLAIGLAQLCDVKCQKRPRSVKRDPLTCWRLASRSSAM